MAVNAAAVHERVDFEVSLQRLECPSLTRATFRGHALGAHPEWLQRLGGALSSKEPLTELDLSSTALDDAALQQLVVMLSKGDVAPHLRTLRLGHNPFHHAGETMLSGLRYLRPALECIRADVSKQDDGTEVADARKRGGEGFVHQKTLVEGLTAWPAASLAIEGSQHLRCPSEVSELLAWDTPIRLERGFQGACATRYTCAAADFELGHATGNLVLLKIKTS